MTFVRVRSGAARRGLLLLSCATVLGLLSAATAGAAGVSVSTLPQGAIEPARLPVENGAIRLTLEEAVATALERNLGLAIDRLGNEQFRLGIDQERGIYDLLLSADTSWAESTTRTSSQLQGGAGVTTLESERATFNLGLAQLVASGGSANVTFSNTYNKSNSNFSNFNPSYSSGLVLSFTQPLLRGFGKGNTDRGLVLARLAETSNRHFFEAQVADLIVRVESAYWDVVETRSQLQVARESLALAEELHRRNRIQVEVGTLPPLELVQSDATIATRQEEIIRAKTAVGNAADALLTLLNVQQGDAWAAELVPATDPTTPKVDVDLAESIRSALAQRPEIAQQKNELERLGVNLEGLEDATRPRLDLGLAYGLSGVGGDQRVTDPDGENPRVLSGGYSDALDLLTSNDFNDWQISATFSYPLQNRAARAQRASGQIDVERGKTRLSELELQVLAEVRTAVRGVEAAWQQIQAAGVSRRLQEKNLEAEQKRYENGMSTSFQVTQIQEDLTLAKSSEVRAIASYRRALASYYRAIGRLLEQAGVKLVAPDAAAASN
ncbi:MAG TPA: TolC family protein [Thermoanaerobaculia bacterium]|nr:TolC family protein [Thermoanaerobaculia bacterium]